MHPSSSFKKIINSLQVGSINDQNPNQSKWIQPVSAAISPSISAHSLSIRLSVPPWTIARQAPLSMGLFQQEYQSGLTFSPPSSLPSPRIETSYPALPSGFRTNKPPGKPLFSHTFSVKKKRERQNPSIKKSRRVALPWWSSVRICHFYCGGPDSISGHGIENLQACMAGGEKKTQASNKRTQKVHIYMLLCARSENKSKKGIIYISK